MPLIGYFKGQPNEYVIKYSSGRITREGQGLAFFYLQYNTQIVAVPTSSMDANLVFNEVTSSFQTVTIQGQFTYRIHNPKRAAELLNFTMDPATHQYVSNDPDRLGQRIANVIQMAISARHAAAVEEERKIKENELNRTHAPERCDLQ